MQVHEVLLRLDATVLMICHRLQHISKFDLVVVLHQGQVCCNHTQSAVLSYGGLQVHEVAPPAALLNDSSSMLFSLCQQAGL